MSTLSSFIATLCINRCRDLEDFKVMNEFVLFTLLVVPFSCVTAKGGIPFIPKMSIRLDRCTSYCNPKYCNITTICRPLNRTSKYVFMDISLHPGVKLKAPVYVEIVTLKKFATAYRKHMIHFKTELCSELELRTHPFLFGMWKNQSNVANLLDPCPIVMHRRSKPRITNVYDYVSPFFPIIPAGDWILNTIISVQRNGSEAVVVSWKDYYEVKTLTAEEF